MSLTRKDFIQLANKIKRLNQEIDSLKALDKTKIKSLVTDSIINFCYGQNALFDEQRFRNACL